MLESVGLYNDGHFISFHGSGASDFEAFWRRFYPGKLLNQLPPTRDGGGEQQRENL